MSKTLEQAARHALEKMEHMVAHGEWYEPEQAIEALRQALEQPKQEPVAWCRSDTVDDWKGQILNIAYMFPFPTGLKNPIPLYTEPQKREWVGLTDEDIEQGKKQTWVNIRAWQSAVWWAEAKLKELNT